MARSYEDAAKEYKRLAWKLDKQMYRLEKASSEQEQYKGILKYAYARMQQEIQNWSPGNTRWGQSLPKDSDPKKALAKLEKKISIMKALEKLPSFSLKRIKKVYGQAAKTINKNPKFGGTSLTWQDIAGFYGSAAAQVMDSQYGSDTTVIALGKFKKMSSKKKQKLADEIKKNPHKKLDNDLAVSKALKTLLEEYYTAEPE